MKQLLFLFISIAIFILFFFLSRIVTQKELTNIPQTKLLCNSKIANCNNTSSPMPKGVCAPGKKCT